jgi:hypothetical protein
MDAIRVAIFDKWWPVRYDKDHPIPKEDSPSDWAKFMDMPRFTEAFVHNGEKWREVRDDRVLDELQRIDTFRTCPICHQSVSLRDTGVEDERFYVCLRCGYWSGIGFRDWNSHLHMDPLRGVIARYRPLSPLDRAQTDYLVTHLRRTPKDLTKLSPKRAEGFVMDLLSDYLDCEVRALGGVKDKGIDGYILAGDELACIIQVKWRESTGGAESVGVVREVAGTLLARGVPAGILVSTRVRYSKEAVSEAQIVSKRKVAGLGRLKLELLDYNDILDMLNLSATRLTERMTVEDWFQVSEDICVFDGAAMISEKYIERFK